MVAKRKLLGAAVVLGVVLGTVVALVRMRDAGGQAAPSVPVASNAVEAIEVRVARTIATPVRPQPLVTATECSQPSNPPPPKVRRRIVNDPKIPKARQVLLANRRIVVPKGRSFPKTFCVTQSPTRRGTAPYVVISERPVDRDVRIQAVSDGAKVIGFLPNNALLVEADRQALRNLEEDVLFMAAVEYEPTDKIQRALLDAAKGDARIEATVALLNEKDVADIRDYIVANGGEMLSAGPSGGTAVKTPRTRNAFSAQNRTLCASMTYALVEALAGKAEVKWIERHARMKAHNDVAVKPGLMNVEPVREASLGLTGAGQVITTSDTGIDTGDTDTMHADLTNAVIAMWLTYGVCLATDTSGHGTHTAGSLVGDGTLSSGKIRGAAPGAKLWAWFCEGSDGYLYPPMYRDGSLACEYLFRPAEIDKSATNAYVHSASWGGGDAGYYSSEMCASIDAFVWQNPDFLPVFAAGNEGIGTMTVSQPATAKNVLAVGASENLRPAKGSHADNSAQIAYFSSCGPCEDGRIKPDIVAPGTYVLSCLSSQASRCGWDDGSYTNYQYMSGTSMATPLTAGTAVLLREWLARYRAKANPSAALVRAIMQGGATDLYYESGSNALKAVPDNRQGWGRVDLAGTIAPTNGLATFLVDWMPFAATSNFTFRVTTTNAAPLNVQLAWVDHPGTESAAKALVNDLDLCVTAGSQTWFGNGGTQADDTNVAESVRIRSAAARTYLVRVTCATIPHDHTEGGAAALYIRGAFDPADITYLNGCGTIFMIQ